MCTPSPNSGLPNAAPKWLRRSRRRRGVALIWMALLLPVLLAFLALASDAGLVLYAAQEMQTAVDSAALAGAALVRTDIPGARTAAVGFAADNSVLKQPVSVDRNDANAGSGDVVVGHYDRTTAVFTATEDTPDAVRVVGHRDDIPLVFTGPLGRSLATVRREAIAMIGGGTGYGVIALNRTARHALHIQGNDTMTVLDVTGASPVPGKIQVNSTDGEGAYSQGSTTINAGELDVCGGADMAGYGGEIHEGAPYVADPLASVPAVTSRTPVYTCPSGDVTIQPGYYPAGIARTGGNLTLSPGVYVLSGAGFDIGGNANVTANGVMLYLTGTGFLSLHGNGTIDITPPTSGPYQYISVFQDRTNTRQSTIIGTKAMNLQGTFYFPSNQIELGGTGIAIGNQLVADTIWMHGTGTFSIQYTGHFPAAGGRVFLVH